MNVHTNYIATDSFSFSYKGSYRNWTRTQNYLIRKRTLNHWASLAEWLSVLLRTKWFWVRVQLQSLKRQISGLLRAKSSLTFRQLESVNSLWKVYVTWQQYTVRSYHTLLTGVCLIIYHIIVSSGLKSHQVSLHLKNDMLHGGMQKQNFILYSFIFLKNASVWVSSLKIFCLSERKR